MMFPPQLIERNLKVDRTAIRLYADITQDYNPIHLDPDFAAKTPMGGIIAHGMLSLSLVWQSLAATFGQQRMADVALNIRFTRPVRENDMVVAGGARIGEQACYNVWVRAEGQGRSETVIAGTATFGASAQGAALMQGARTQS
jgi:3-hydroxybutyryl-CoA dehydratase